MSKCRLPLLTRIIKALCKVKFQIYSECLCESHCKEKNRNWKRTVNNYAKGTLRNIHFVVGILRFFFRVGFWMCSQIARLTKQSNMNWTIFSQEWFFYCVLKKSVWTVAKSVWLKFVFCHWKQPSGKKSKPEILRNSLSRVREVKQVWVG